MQGEDTAKDPEPLEVPSPTEGPAEAAAEAQLSLAGKADEYFQSLVRLKADFDNYRRRTAQDQARWGEAAVAGFIVQLLPVVDNLERALGAAGDAVAVRQGVEMTLRQCVSVLADAGVTPMAPVGQPFDPARHEAVARGPAPGVAAGAVAQEYRKGYVLRDQVLRPAMVKVATDADGEAPGLGDSDAAEASHGPGAAKEGDR